MSSSGKGQGCLAGFAGKIRRAQGPHLCYCIRTKYPVFMVALGGVSWAEGSGSRPAAQKRRAENHRHPWETGHPPRPRAPSHLGTQFLILAPLT